MVRLDGPEGQASGPSEAACTCAAAAVAAARAGDRERAATLLAGLTPDLAAAEPGAAEDAGAAWLAIGETARAGAFLETALRAGRDTPRLRACLGACLLGLGQPALAVPHLERAAVAGGATAAASEVNLARALNLLDRHDEALAALDRAAGGVHAASSLYLRSRAEALEGLGRTEEALALLAGADTSDQAALLLRCTILCAHLRHDEAAQALREALAAAPEAVPLLTFAADLAEARGRRGEAAAFLRRALVAAPEEPELWCRLAMLDRLGGARAATAEAAAKAMALTEGRQGPARALALCALAHAVEEEERAADLAEAEAHYLAALETAPGFVPALSGLGRLLLQLGRVDEAIACYEQVREAAPVVGWSQLIHARQVPDDPEVLDRLEQAARRPGLQGPVRASLLFDCAAAREQRREHDRAMALAREANEASKPLLPYDPRAHRDRVDREMARFSAAFMESRRGWGDPSRLPVFVLGMPRSGTTLVEQILGSHSRVHGAGELGQVGELIQRLAAWEARLGSGIGWPDCVTDLTAEESRRLAARMLEDLQAYDLGAARVVDKLPHNFEHVGLILLMFPNAAVVHCRREPRDVALSNYFTDYAAKFGGMGFAYDLGWIGEQLVDHDRLMTHWNAVFPGRILEVRYEELVEDTEAWARRMIAHLGLDWEPGVLAFKDLERPVRTASAWQVRQPVYTSSRARWRRHEGSLGPLEMALAEAPAPPATLPAPAEPPGLFLAGMAALRAGEAAAAEERFARLLTANPRHAAAHHFRGAALARLGRPDAAREAMRRSLRLRPGHAAWMENLAALEEAAGDAAAAAGLREAAAGLRAVKGGAPHIAPGAGHPAAMI